MDEPEQTRRTAPTSLRPLQPGEVHVWYLWAEHDPAADVLPLCQALLSDEEQARQQRLRQERDRRQFLLARTLVRVLLGRYAGVDPRAWVFATGRHGKPEIAEPLGTLPLRFNLSHTTGLVAAAFALERAVGVDVEITSRRNAILDIARRFFSAQEAAYLSTLSADEQHSVFFDIWTLKEAYIKARGMGLALPLGAFSFHLSHEQPTSITFAPELEDDPATWQFATCSPGPQHRLSVAVQRPADTTMPVVIREAVLSPAFFTAREG